MTPTPYRKVNIVDENGDFVDLGSGDDKSATAENQSIQINKLTDILNALTDSTTETPVYSLQSGVYVVTAGAKRVYVANFGESDGIVLGAVLPPKTSIPFEASPGNILSAIATDGTGTSLAIVEIR
ncbi:MAG: hypothetical protein QNJ36_19790 [Calothrix sp. MO_167.B42]|nr:hypothetical protein [Calothrix sp. MO_167.B42]